MDYLVFIKLKEWLRKITSSETTFEKIFKQTKSTEWLPSPSLSDGKICSPRGRPLTSISGSIKSSKTSMPSKMEENGFVHYINEVEHETCFDGHVSPKTDVKTPEHHAENRLENSRTSPSESGICVNSCNSILLSPEIRPLDQGSDSSLLHNKGDNSLQNKVIEDTTTNNGVKQVEISVL